MAFGFVQRTADPEFIPSFKENRLTKCGPRVTRRFISSFCLFADKVSNQATSRENNEVLSLDAYMSFRRDACGVRSSLDLVEYCLGIDLPEYVHDDPLFKRGYDATLDLVSWMNVRLYRWLIYILQWLTGSVFLRARRIYTPSKWN